MCNESLGQCVSIKQCSDAIEFNDGSNMFQVRFGDDEEEVESCHYLETCCDPENIIEVLELPEDTFPRLETGNSGTEIPSNKPTREFTSPRTPPPYHPTENESDDDAATTEAAISEENRNQEDELPVTQLPHVLSATVPHSPSISINVSHYFPKNFPILKIPNT